MGKKVTGVDEKGMVQPYQSSWMMDGVGLYLGWMMEEAGLRRPSDTTCSL